MHKAMMLLAGLAVLGGCGAKDQPQRKQADDARDIAMVERMNQTPFRPIQPEPFTADDLARYGLAGDGCTFRRGERADDQALFVAQQDRAYIKVGGVVTPLAVKGGSAELPSGAHSTYIGLDSWIELVAQAGQEEQGRAGNRSWPSRLVIHDAAQRVAFDARGQVSCDASASKG
jgi:hypothetical protein